jgi:large subunit ribosomal protein L21
MYAVIQTGGKQYRVKKGDTVQVELLPLELGAEMEMKEVLLVGVGPEVKVGQPHVASASVNAEVVAIEKGPKIIVYHKRRRKQYDKKVGHRQPYTRLLITGVSNGAGEKDMLSATEKKEIMGRVGFVAKDAWAYEPESLTEETMSETKAPKAAAKKSAPKAAPKKAAAKKK